MSRVVVVTGAGTGIGRAIAARLGAGAFVACLGRRARLCEETLELVRAAGGDGVALSMDVTDQESVAAAVAAIRAARDRIDVLVNNAGVGGPNDMASEDDRWSTIIATNLDGTYRVTRAALPCMPDGGRILNIASVLGRFGVPGYTAYCASKHGIVGLTRALALELAPRRITVNAVCPGWVATDMAIDGMRAGAAARGIELAAFERDAMTRVPIGRMLEPAEVAALCSYLASDDAAGMTGQALDLNGGSFMG
ncbi:MAG: SDR family NAD(P)-dependent oxidoreductase [Acidobacteriota bacterium]